MYSYIVLGGYGLLLSKNKKKGVIRLLRNSEGETFVCHKVIE